MTQKTTQTEKKPCYVVYDKLLSAIAEIKDYEQFKLILDLSRSTANAMYNQGMEDAKRIYKTLP